MGEVKKVAEEVIEDVEEIPAKSGPAGLVLVFYIVTGILGIIALGFWFLWTR